MSFFGNLFGSLGGPDAAATPTTPQPDPYGGYYNKKAAMLYALGNMGQGLGYGLMTRDWKNALNVSNADANGYQEQAMKKAASARMFEEADAKKQERARAEEERKRRQEYIQQFPADVQVKMLSIPGYMEKYIEATDPAFQQPQEQKRYNVGGALVDENGNVIYQGPGDSNNVTTQIEERRAAAEALGLTPNDPAYKSYILTGKMPREDQAPLTATDKQAILAADDAVMTNQTVVDQLKSVITPGQNGKSINDTAGYGWNANIQSWAARNDGTGFFNDEQGQATTELNNIVLGQALQSLKSVFGAAPTEGERKILVDLQASVDKTPTERKAIIERAIKLAELRLQYNKQRAEGLRGQTYYKPGGGGPITTPDGYTIEEVPDGQ